MKKAVLILLVLSLAGVLGAADFLLKKGGVMIWFPDGWNVYNTQNKALLAFSPRNDVLCRLDAVVRWQDYQTIINYDFTDFRQRQRGPVAIPGGRNGLAVSYVQGTANRDGYLWDLTVDLYSFGTHTVVFVYGMVRGADPYYQGQRGQLKKMIESIRQN